MFEPHGPKRLSDIVTGDETWFPFFIIQSKRLNRMWVDGQGDRPVVLRPGFQSRKRMFTSKGHNSVTAGARNSSLAQPRLQCRLGTMLFWLFPILKDRLAGRKFDRIQDLAKAVNLELRTIPEDDYQGVFQKKQISLKRCIESHEEYYEGV
ncbi:transposase [Elysia marginata]|uniref:Transposase n=1 Tax=Elysia marginata TaxID=1093978 RepID=A0AAV4GJS1_9GAST|nr:transposase [Elysia marginata]